MKILEIGFKDKVKTDKIFQKISQPTFYNEFITTINERLLQLLAESVDPDMALNNFDRFLDSCIDHSAIYSMFANIPVSLEILIRLCGESQFLADVLVRNPELLSWLLVEGQLNETKSYQQYQEQINEWISPVRNYQRKMNNARRFHRRELLRIGARDVLKLGDILEMAQELADLASALIQLSFESASQLIEKEYGKPQVNRNGKLIPCKFAVIGMGKLGGRELNFSSDIDVLFVYDDEGDTTKGFSNHEYFSRVSQEIVKFLHDSTDQGRVYRIDLRLRPEGSAGPLARSLDSYEMYYQEFAETWERIALIKARVVGGDEVLGKQFSELIIPFVYRRYLDYSSVNEIKRLKIRLQTEIAGKKESGIEIKSGMGGIREIEFYTCLMQLLHGGKLPQLQIQNTCKVLNLLIDNKIIDKEDGLFLIEAYIFLRRVEQKLQLLHQLQTHHIPDEADVMDKLGRQMGYPDREGFLAALQKFTQRVNQMFLSVFEDEHVSGLKDTESQISFLMDESTAKGKAMEELSKFNFHEPAEGLQIFHKLVYGTRDHIVSQDERKRLRLILSELLNSLKDLPNPDLGLRQFTRFVEKYGSNRALYSWLSENKEKFQRLLFILSCSVGLGDLIINEPGRFDSILTKLDKDELLEMANTPLSDYKTLHDLKKYWEERKLILGILDLIEPDQHLVYSKILTSIADILIQEILNYQFRELKMGKYKDVGFAVLGLGKMGGEELTCGSDFDLVFVYADLDAIDNNKTLKKIIPLEYSTVCQLVEKILKGIKQYLGEVDIRLRPEGNKGALAMTPGPFEQYFEKRASFWERLAWMKARPIAGNLKLANLILESSSKFVYQSKVEKGTVKEITTMRMRMQSAIKDSKNMNRDLKVGIGGLVDLEFIIQYLVLKHGYNEKSLRSNNLMKCLRALVKNKYINTKYFEILHENYLFFTKLQSRIRYMSNSSNNLIPENEIELLILTKLMGYSSPDIFLDTYQTKALQNRQLFKEAIK